MKVCGKIGGMAVADVLHSGAKNHGVSNTEQLADANGEQPLINPNANEDDGNAVR